MNVRWKLSVVVASFALFGFHQENGCGGSEGPPECELLLCAQNCTDGTRVDADGCPTCECLPPPPPPPGPCEGLDEESCISDSACEPIYDFTDCDPAIDSGDASGLRAPCAAQYSGCRERTGCEGLDEASCSADPQCQPIYYDVACDVAPCSPDDAECFRAPCPSTFAGCVERDPCEGLDEQACLADPACTPQYGEAYCTTECRPDPNDPEGCLPCDPAIVFTGCYSGGWCGTPEPHPIEEK